MALRRILRSLVIKKRESANRSQMATWEQNDLLFISSYGEQDNRELTFAHFSDNTGMGDLPTLDLRFQEIEEGNLLYLLRAVAEHLNHKFLTKAIDFEGLQRIEKGEYPVAAVREMLLKGCRHAENHKCL